MVMVMVIRNFG